MLLGVMWCVWGVCVRCVSILAISMVLHIIYIYSLINIGHYICKFKISGYVNGCMCVCVWCMYIGNSYGSAHTF